MPDMFLEVSQLQVAYSGRSQPVAAQQSLPRLSLINTFRRVWREDQFSLMLNVRMDIDPSIILISLLALVILCMLRLGRVGYRFLITKHW